MTTYVINGTKIEDTDTIAYRPNPKRSSKKAWARYEAYQEATSLEEYFSVMEEFEQDGQPLKKAVMLADLRYDLEKGFLYLVTEEDEEDSYGDLATMVAEEQEELEDDSAEYEREEAAIEKAAINLISE